MNSNEKLAGEKPNPPVGLPVLAKAEKVVEPKFGTNCQNRLKDNNLN